MSKVKRTTINLQGSAIILSQREDEFNYLEFDVFASKKIADYSMNTWAIGRFILNMGFKSPIGLRLAAALKVGTV